MNYSKYYSTWFDPDDVRYNHAHARTYIQQMTIYDLRFGAYGEDLYFGILKDGYEVDVVTGEIVG